MKIVDSDAIISFQKLLAENFGLKAIQQPVVKTWVTPKSPAFEWYKGSGDQIISSHVVFRMWLNETAIEIILEFFRLAAFGNPVVPDVNM